MKDRRLRSRRLAVVVARAAWTFHASRLRYRLLWGPPLRTFRDAVVLIRALDRVWRWRAPVKTHPSD